MAKPRSDGLPVILVTLVSVWAGSEEAQNICLRCGKGTTVSGASANLEF
jgi:hypothetical protein